MGVVLFFCAIRPVISFSAEGCYLFIEVEMSWQAYVDTQMIQKNLKQAAIAGHDGNIWAKSADFNISNDDIKKLLNNYENSAEMAASGINLAGQKYFYLSGTDEVLRGKQGKGGVHIMKTNQTVLIGSTTNLSRVLKLLTLPRGSAATSRIAATEREAVQPHGFGKASLKALLSRMKVLVLAVSFCQVLCIFMNFNVTINS